MASQYEKLFPNFKPPSKLDSEIVIRAREYLKSRQRKIALMPKVSTHSKFCQLTPRQNIQIPSMISISLSNTLQYQRPQKSYEMQKIQTPRSRKSCMRLTISSLSSRDNHNFTDQRIDVRSQNNSKNEFSLINPFTSR